MPYAFSETQDPLTCTRSTGFSSSLYRRMKPLLGTFYLLGMLVPGWLGYDRWVWSGRRGDWYDLDCLNGKLLFNISAVGLSTLPTHYTHHHEIRIIMPEILSLNITLCVCVCVCVLVAQSCLALCNAMDCSLPSSSVHGILQARILFQGLFPTQESNWALLCSCCC